MKTKFYLRKSSKKTTIYFEFRNGTKNKLRVSTGFSINNEKEWKPINQRIKLPSSTINAKIINSKLSDMESELNKLYVKMEMEDINIELITKIFNKIFGKKNLIKAKFQNKNIESNEYNGKSLNNVLNYYDYYVEKYQKVPLPSTKKLLKKVSTKAYKSSKKKLELFLSSKKIYNFTFNDINESFYESFIDYLYTCDFSINYIGTIIKRLKSVMKSSFDKEIHSNIAYLKPYFVAQFEIINHPYLNTSEIDKIINLKINDEDDENIRNIFAIQCLTGYRIEDLLNQLKNPDITTEGDKRFFHTIQLKTQNEVYIPITSKILKIISENKGKLPKYVHQNIINKRIKEICKEAGITKKYSITRTYGRERKIITLPKYKFVATHTARRSFCTNAYMAGVRVHHIMSISGHKTEKVFLNYVKVEKRFEAIKIAEHPYFK
ncbi:tyrosine-type recombinase/integrase [Lutibacter sp.]|uniref:tyrosine-type recombinase/integrase n=1 Tax=Lutibacter sp. TaxID=1925666 RepID=UPI0025BAAA50|nr:tyrosine-type recombinase/integrase [Lutibacter sp.]MCF6180495.1 site-specific integrase [Lutibacter sp.]